jgi:two-component system cell cycle sensor histidine kinase/response regulator CckA
MAADILALALDPFFTTKDVGDGTGLGLSTVYGIATQNGGNMRLSSTPGEGTTVEVYMPLTAAGALPGPGPQNSNSRLDGHETILLVEDEPAVFELTARVLRNSGYIVLGAHNGEEALEIVRSHSSQIDLMLCDVIMPRLTGPQLYEKISEFTQPPVTLFMSGHAGESLTDAHKIKDVTMVAKPFTPSELLTRVRKIFDT